MDFLDYMLAFIYSLSKTSRFRKESSADSKTRRDALQKAATIERDSHPFLFKYNEVYSPCFSHWYSNLEMDLHQLIDHFLEHRENIYN